jgi:hypothetical protein
VHGYSEGEQRIDHHSGLQVLKNRGQRQYQKSNLLGMTKKFDLYRPLCFLCSPHHRFWGVTWKGEKHMPSESERIEKLERRVKSLEDYLHRVPVPVVDGLPPKIRALEARVEVLEQDKK